MVEAEDPLLDGAKRMVKRGSAEALRAVYVAGACVVRDGEPLPALGREPLGRVLTLGPAPAARDPISLAIPDHPFTDYWDVFVLKHQHPANVALHVVAVAMLYGGVALALAASSPWPLLLVPASQATGLLGHWLFEPSHIDKRDAIFSTRASLCLNRMFVRVLSGTYFSEVRRLRAALEAHLGGRLAA